MAAPWAGIALGALGLGLAHQLGSDNVFNDCRSASPAVVLIACLAGLVIIAAGAAISWKVWRRHDEGPARKLIASVSLMIAGLFAFALLLPMIASLVLPACHA